MSPTTSRRLIETGAVGFGGRAAELGSLIDSLSVVRAPSPTRPATSSRSSTASTRRPPRSPAADRVDQLLVNLAQTTQVLADNRELTLQTLRDLTRLAQDQNELVFQPYRDDIDRQIGQLDAILAASSPAQRQEVGILVDWLAAVHRRHPLGRPRRLRPGLRLVPARPLDGTRR